MNKKYIRTSGFTIVELLIVVVVIAILAAITIISYNGIANQAKDSALKSDLTTSAKKLHIDKINNGSFPTERPDYLGDTIQYTSDGTAFCITASKDGRAFFTRETGTVEAGACPGHTIDGGGSMVAANGTGEVAEGGDYRVYALPNGMYFATAWGSIITIPSPLQDIDHNVDNEVYLAGNGEYGHADGQGASARFGSLGDIAVDASGNIYTPDHYNPGGVEYSYIRKITPGGVVTTIAGGEYGHADGQGASARFGSLGDIAVDASGNIYTPDYYDSGGVQYAYIRKITPAGVVATIAGGEYGHADGQGASARFRDLSSNLVTDLAGNIYATYDYYSDLRLRKVTPSGLVTTLDWLTGNKSSANIFFNKQTNKIDIYLYDRIPD